ncbi:MAG: hypothetical protein ABI675_20185 [Chitinophagaceae bacterium]
MKWQLIIFFLVIAAGLSCSDSSSQAGGKENKIADIKKPGNKPAGSYSDTIKINFPSAVFYTPDSLQLEKIKAVTDSVIFESNIHDCFYQMRYSHSSLRKSWPKIKIVEAKNVRFILFEPAGGNRECVDLDSLNDPCGVLVFDGNKRPRLVDMTNIDTELGFYFSE